MNRTSSISFWRYPKFVFGLVLTIVAFSLAPACDDASQKDKIGQSEDQLQGCELNAPCTTPGEICYWDQTANSGLLVCDLSDPLNKHFVTACINGYYCEPGVPVSNTVGYCDDGNGGMLRCDDVNHKLGPSACGDGVLDPGEVCDDGAGNMGCAGTCAADCSAVITGCGDGVVCGTEQCDDGDSVNGDACSNLCTITGCGDGVIGPFETCDDGKHCDNMVPDDPNTVAFDPVPGTPCLQDSDCVDANNIPIGDGLCLPRSGDGCDSNCTPTMCGNGVVDANELCDDGNNVNGDGCDNDCSPSGCGNGVVTWPEQCDEGVNNSNTGTCTTLCMLPKCGDGFIQAGEACDDGNTMNGDTCHADCTLPACGDGIVDPGEQCDDGAGNGFGNDCNDDCTLPYCGDGVTDPNEECDDGNNVSGDGCSASCKAEPSCVEQDPVPCVVGAYGCLGSVSGLCVDANSQQLQCQCANPNDSNKGTWLPPGSPCDTVCWSDTSGSGGAGGAGGASGTGGGGGSSTTGTGGGSPGCVAQGDNCSDGACCEGLTCVDSGDGGFFCEPSTPVIPPGWVQFTWTEPASYNQPNANVTAQGMINGGSWGVICTMTESAPGSGVWGCMGAVASGSSLIFNVAHADPAEPMSQMCWAFDQCDKYCSGDGTIGNQPDTAPPGFSGETDGVDFGTVTLTGPGGNIPFNYADNGIDAFLCTRNGTVLTVP